MFTTSMKSLSIVGGRGVPSMRYQFDVLIQTTFSFSAARPHLAVSQRALSLVVTLGHSNIAQWASRREQR